MGDAVRDGDVHSAELDDTIDAANPRPEPAPSPMPVDVVAASRDYHELTSVDRHHYAITREIARGGIGRVFEARDLRLGRQVAIKELLPRNRDAARRFEREARVTARLQHPSIIHVYEAGVWPGGEPFYAMPLVSGRSLDKVVTEKQTLDERLGLLPNVIAVADALAYAHNANVIHRDLKPANVLVGDFGETVVIDWGLAKDLGAVTDPKESLQLRVRAAAEETMSGSVVGTPAYMAPEQARGDAVDQRADVYALGALLYKVLVGAAPYTGANGREVIEQVKAGPPVPAHDREPGAPIDLLAIVAKAMARDPARRYATAGELAQDLKRFETGQLVGAHHYTVRELVRRWLRRHRVAVSITIAALVALIGFGVFSVQRIVYEKRLANDARDVANARRTNLLEERGRTELLAGRAGAALAYLVGAAEDGKSDAARGFLIADAMRPFQAELAHIALGPGSVVVAVSPDGHHIAAGGTGVTELRTGAKAITLAAHGVTRVVAFDDASSKLVAAGDDGVARVWSVDGLPIATLRGHAGAILDAVFSHDGKRLITTGNDATVRIWDLATQVADTVDCHAGPVVSVRVSPDGHYVVTAGADSIACIIGIEGGEPALSPRVMRKLKGHGAPVNSATWSPDGRLVVTASDDGTAKVWSAQWGKPIVDSLRHDLGSSVQVALMVTDRLVVTAGSDQVARVWELPNQLPSDGMSATPAQVRRKLLGHGTRIVAAALSADRHQLATGGFDGVAKVWDLESGQELKTFEHGDVVTSVAFIADAAQLATGSRDGTARVWSTTTYERRENLDSAVNALAIAADGTVAAGLDDSVVTLLHGTDKQQLHGHLSSVLALAFTPDGRLITAGEDAAAIVWDARTGKQLGTLAASSIEPPSPVRAVAIHPDGDRVALVRGGKVEVWSLASRTKVRELAPSKGEVEALSISPTGAIAAVGHDGTFVVWDAAGNARELSSDRSYNVVTFSANGDALVTAGAGLADVWTVDHDRVGKIDVPLDAGTGLVRTVLVTPDGSRVITAGDTGQAKIWDRGNGKLLGTRDRHDKAISSLALHGDALWIGSSDQTLDECNVRVETGSVASLKQFIDEHVPVELKDDVVRKRRR